MSIRWDALLVRHTARELARAFVGRRLRAVRFDRSSRDVAMLFPDDTLLWRLHPSRGHVRVLAPLEPVDGDYRLRGRLQALDVPPDERQMSFRLGSSRAGPVSVVVELMGNQWNALVLEGDPAVIRHALWKREGTRGRAVGDPYEPPRPLARAGVHGDVDERTWIEALAAVPRGERPRALVRHFAWTSPLNATSLLEEGGADDEASLRRGFRRWSIFTDPEVPVDAVVLETARGAQPYPFPLPAIPHHRAESLLAAFDECETPDEGTESPSGLALVGHASISRLEVATERAERRAARLEEELRSLEDPVVLRAIGDLILARYGDIPPGASAATLSGFDGAEVEVRLDATKAPHENASRYYREAAKSERARARLPDLVSAVRSEHARLDALLGRVRAGRAGEDEIREALGPERAALDAGPGAPSLPYRSFRSSGGLEIRVGRGARHNDDLTFRHSSPGDVWMHAQQSPGAHVILRWPGEGKPPLRDLREAATLAALHSKARTSGTVPIDWTLRKYVRKPRKAAPGSVVPDRVQTLFVEPDASLIERLAARAEGSLGVQSGPE